MSENWLYFICGAVAALMVAYAFQAWKIPKPPKIQGIPDTEEAHYWYGVRHPHEQER